MKLTGKRWMVAGVAVGVTAALVAMGAGGGAQAAPQPVGVPVVKAAAPDRVVTLITGDRVVVRGGDLKKVTVTAGKEREGAMFRIGRENGRLTVLPLDVAKAVAEGRLDRRLFDITGLLAMQYDDAHTSAIPLLVESAGPRAALRGTSFGPVLGGSGLSAAKVDKASAGAFLTGMRARSAGGTIWLDAKRQTQLDQSVPQIGVPAAWKAGFTGKGVPVAILDSGIDAGHPDFKGQIVASKNFTEEPAGDALGHGTHVASTVAGTAAASKGKYKGVAPGARLIDGKICDGEGGCSDSAILAGMEWAAVQQKARVINMSLGIWDEPGVDPIEAAVNRLTAKTGALFVVAAGNEGPDGRTVRSPGTAASALTVGSVDKKDVLADTSSRGPLLEGSAIKPDVTAPGVDIVAAKAKNSQIGTPVGTNYLQLSGTSMATPHVAGAAAILAQQHPKWKAAELKAALMATAKQLPGQSVFEQGSGRIDVARAITDSVVSVPGSIGFGTALWPHADDKPIAKKLTYRNLGTKPVTLLLQTSSTVGGKPGPAGAFKLSARKLTVPAGGTAAVTVTSDTRHSGPDGLYSGRVVATAKGVSVGTPLAADKEIESYNVTVRHLMLDGKGTEKNYTRIFSLDQEKIIEVPTDANGVAKLRIPRGRYLVEGLLGDTSDRLYQLLWPNLTVDRAMTLAVDARKAKPAAFTMPRKNTALVEAQFDYHWEGKDFFWEGNISTQNLDKLYVGSIGAPLDGFTATINSRFVVQRKAGDNRNAPYDYNLVQSRKRTYFTGYRRTVREAELGRIQSQYAVDVAGRIVTDERFGWLPGAGGSTAGIRVEYDGPVTATHFVEARDGGGAISWDGNVSYLHREGGNDDELWSLTSEGPKSNPGQQYGERWGRSVVNAGLQSGDSSYRTGNELALFMFPLTDADGHAGTGLTGAEDEWTKLYRNGKLVASESVAGQISLDNAPAEKSTYRLETSVQRSKSQLGTRVDHVWTFASQNTGDAKVVLPLRDVHFQPAVDALNSVPRTTVTTLPLTVVNQPGAKPAPIESVAVQFSADAGKTWQRAIVVPGVGGSYSAVFRTPAGKVVSLRSTVKDRDGGTATQTVINAYRIR
ncbi:S8 family serine peptidase [Kribbella sp. NPDC056951]|uniref:S8 family peptidase n=1 Tax=Kribbella sp. NPDC056951 TaxID=3345978 RepID=UPI003644202A